MKIVIKNNTVIATHADDQQISIYDYKSSEGVPADAVVTVSESYDLGDEYILDESTKQSALISDLWNAATKYQMERCDSNGVAAIVGKMASGAMTGVSYVKASANRDWWQKIWTDYNTRKALYLASPSTYQLSFNFSNNGDLPYSIAEMLAE